MWRDTPYRWKILLLYQKNNVKFIWMKWHPVIFENVKAVLSKTPVVKNIRPLIRKSSNNWHKWTLDFENSSSGSSFYDITFEKIVESRIELLKYWARSVSHYMDDKWTYYGSVFNPTKWLLKLTSSRILR